MKNILSITEARSTIFDIAVKAQKHGNHYLFTENGKPKLAIMSADEYESLMEDLFLLSDPTFAAKMKKADEEFARGEVISLKDLEKELGMSRKKDDRVTKKKK